MNGSEPGATGVQPPSASGTPPRSARPRPVGGGLEAGVRELHGRHRAVGGDERGHRPPGVDVRAGPEAGVLRADPALGEHGGRLGQHQAGAADRAGAEVDQVPVGGQAVGAGGVLAHRRHGDPVGQGDRRAGPGG